MRRDRGVQLLECCIGVFLVSTLFLAGIACYDGVRVLFDARHSVEKISRAGNLRPLTLVASGGSASTQINVAALRAWLDQGAADLKAKLEAHGYPAWAELKAVSMPIDPLTGAWKGSLDPVAIGASGDFTPPSGTIANSDAALLAFAYAAQRPGQASALAVPAVTISTTRKANYLDRVILISASGAINLGNSFTGETWQVITGSPYIAPNKVSVLRGDINKVQL